MQLVVGCLLWWLGNNAQQLIEQVGSALFALYEAEEQPRILQEEPNVKLITAIFFTLVFFAATQGPLTFFSHVA